jgi:hypothetical protein
MMSRITLNLRKNLHLETIIPEDFTDVLVTYRDVQRVKKTHKKSRNPSMEPLRGHRLAVSGDLEEQILDIRD